MLLWLYSKTLTHFEGKWPSQKIWYLNSSKISWSQWEKKKKLITNAFDVLESSAVEGCPLLLQTLHWEEFNIDVKMSNFSLGERLSLLDWEQKSQSYKVLLHGVLMANLEGQPSLFKELSKLLRSKVNESKNIFKPSQKTAEHQRETLNDYLCEHSTKSKAACPSRH